MRRIIGVVVLFAALASTAVFAFGRKEKSRSADAPGADLAVIELRVHEIKTAGAEPRLAIQALVENQKPVGRTGTYEVQVRRKGGRKPLGACQGEALPQGQIAICELWLDNEPVRHGDVFEAALNRSVGNLGSWDSDPSNDSKAFEMRTIVEGGQVLRLVEFDMIPQTIQGAADVQFRFQVEGAHLVWLLAEDRAPRLLAGHPADGLLQGKGKERISTSGPAVLVARSSAGSFVYKTVPIVNAYQEVAPAWTRVPPQKVDGAATMKVLDPGVYDVDEDAVILQGLRAYLSSKDWLAAVDRLREQQREGGKPRPASVLNPKARGEEDGSGEEASGDDRR